MFEVGDKVEIIAEGDPLKGQFGKVEELYHELSNFRPVGVRLDDGGELGNPVLWFFPTELRKVDA
jgi:hypothetical protein